MMLLLASVVMAAEVTLHVMSSGENPSFELSGAQMAHLRSLLTGDASSSYFGDRVMGYRGFEVDGVVVYNNPVAERFLLLHSGVSQSIRAHVASIIDMPNRQRSRQDKLLPRIPVVNHPVIKGPDNVTEYDPKKWNVASVQPYNNCYNYANDIRTDTFAQPGRGTGKKWTSNTCEDITASALRDGLVQWKGEAPLGALKPEKGHFIALYIWPGTNFHWAKKDLNTNWSHKPGQTAARDTDNNGKKITDPSKADLSPWSQFCGYFVGVPSVITVE